MCAVCFERDVLSHTLLHAGILLKFYKREIIYTVTAYFTSEQFTIFFNRSGVLQYSGV